MSAKNLDTKTAFQKIEEIVASASPDEIAASEYLTNFKKELDSRKLAEEKQKILGTVCSLMGHQYKDKNTWEDFCKTYLMSQGYKKISKRRGGGIGKRNVKTSLITPDKIAEAKKLMESSKHNADYKGIARKLEVNTNSLKKALGIARRVTRTKSVAA